MGTEVAIVEMSASSHAGLEFMDVGFDGMQITFGERFLQDHAGTILTDPRTALIELIANAYDAGATRAVIEWPDALDAPIRLSDNGTGMTREQFYRRWSQLNYNRFAEQPRYVEFPPDVAEPPRRRAFGRNGKGRHASFCFADEYLIQTARDGERTAAKVRYARGTERPFDITACEPTIDFDHGTVIEVVLRKNFLSARAISDAVGGKFLVDPRFEIVLNGRTVHLETFGNQRTSSLDTPEGRVVIHAIDGQSVDRTTKLRGITYWVNGRMVGDSSWDGLDETGAILDGRTGAAKRYSFIVEADILQDEVRADWRGFNGSDRALSVLSSIRQEIVAMLETFLRETIRDRKRAALLINKLEIQRMPPVSKKALGEFVDSVQQKCPTLSEDVLGKTVEVFAKMESARTGHSLLRQLADCSPDDLDRWSEIVEAWTAQDAKHVLDELGRRLALIKQLERLVNNKGTDELHELHPLFELGLWVFGPEYERVDFKSNRALSTVIRDMLGGARTPVNSPARRPDLVALQDSTLSVYSADAYDSEGEADGFDRVLVVELKRGGFQITSDELWQASRYAQELRKGNRVNPNAKMTAFVLGTQLAADAREEIRLGDSIAVRPMVYDHFIRRAHNRTFHLLERVSAASNALLADPDIEEVLAQGDLFEQESNSLTAAASL